ncbi:hypothetical protein A2U01_0055185, partial [Trifolium medium]|nr:hypothetical protein [Trifolium medium]
SNGTQAEGTA